MVRMISDGSGRIADSSWKLAIAVYLPQKSTQLTVVGQNMFIREEEITEKSSPEKSIEKFANYGIKNRRSVRPQMLKKVDNPIGSTASICMSTRCCGLS